MPEITQLLLCAMKNDWLQLLLELKQAVCSSYHRQVKGGRLKTFSVGDWEEARRQFFSTLVLFKLSQTAREKRKCRVGATHQLFG